MMVAFAIALFIPAGTLACWLDLLPADVVFQYRNEPVAASLESRPPCGAADRDRPVVLHLLCNVS